MFDGLHRGTVINFLLISKNIRIFFSGRVTIFVSTMTSSLECRSSQRNFSLTMILPGIRAQEILLVQILALRNSQCEISAQEKFHECFSFLHRNVAKISFINRSQEDIFWLISKNIMSSFLDK